MQEYRIDFAPSAPIIEANVSERQLREKVEISSWKNNFSVVFLVNQLRTGVPP